VTEPAAAATARTSSIKRRWVAWSARQKFGRKDFRPDSTPEQVLNHAIWYGTKGYRTPYPGEHKVLTPRQVAERYPDEDGTEAR
jgi:hypothetical protein